MNRFLIKTLEIANIVIALLIIARAVYWGYLFPVEGDGHIFMIGLGIFVGLVVAALVCGLLAIFIEIEKHLRKLASLPDLERIAASKVA
jgi:hypothetical protein